MLLLRFIKNNSGSRFYFTRMVFGDADTSLLPWTISLCYGKTCFIGIVRGVLCNPQLEVPGLCFLLHVDSIESQIFRQELK